MRHRAFVQKILSDLRASYWFVPSCLVIAAMILAEATLALDRSGVDLSGWLPESLTDTQLDGARSTLTVAAQSVIGVTGVMFSVTMVAVSFASGNFGPRLIGNFMRDRGNQWSLGILISTFVYALLILQSLHAPASVDADAFVPQISVLLGMALTFGSVFVMIYFVHHIPETINVANIASGLGERFRDALVESARFEVPGQPPHLRHSLSLDKPGYIQRLDVSRLDTVAETHGLTIVVDAVPGIFVDAHQCVVRTDRALDDDITGELREAFAVGRSKTEDQSPLFIADEQVEMIARALSPGVNDPFTAINGLNWLAAAIVEGAAKGSQFGLEGTGRVYLPSIELSEILDRTFGASWQYVAPDDLTRRRWNALLDRMEGGDATNLAAAVRALRARLEACPGTGGDARLAG